MKILVVDDEFVSRMTLQKIMRSIGECEAVENGEEALKVAFSDQPPDLILLDIMMPGMDGYTVCKRLRADPSTKDTPIIFLSANTKVEDITKGFELGAVDYITKPFQKAEVKARVRTHLALKQMREEMQDKNFLLNKQVDEIKVQCQGTHDGLFIRHFTAVRFKIHLADFLRVVGCQANKDQNANNRNRKVQG